MKRYTVRLLDPEVYIPVSGLVKQEAFPHVPQFLAQS